MKAWHFGYSNINFVVCNYSSHGVMQNKIIGCLGKVNTLEKIDIKHCLGTNFT